MKPMGVLPRVVADTDDDVLSAQCSAELQLANTTVMLEHLGCMVIRGITDEDLPFLFRHVRLEHKWHMAQVPRLRRVRDKLTGCTEVLEDYRLRLQK